MKVPVLVPHITCDAWALEGSLDTSTCLEYWQGDKALTVVIYPEPEPGCSRIFVIKSWKGEDGKFYQAEDSLDNSIQLLSHFNWLIS